MASMTLWGFEGSTYVRTVKMVFAEKQFSDFDQVQIDVLKGEPKAPDHLERHPFGKVPVLDHGDLRLIETSAIARYLSDVLPGRPLVPGTPRDRARMDVVISLLDSYGYNSLIGGVAAYHLFPDFVGGKNEAALEAGRQTGRKVIEYAMRTRDGSPFIAGELSLADLYLAPVVAYIALTPDKGGMLDSPAVAEWWERMQALPSFAATQPSS